MRDISGVMLLYVISMALATFSVIICFITALLCFSYPRRSVFLFNVACLLFSDGMSAFTFILWSIPKTTICSCTLFLPLQNFLFLHSFACTMLIARRFKQATSDNVIAKEKWFWLYTFLWSFTFNVPLMLVNYLALDGYPDVSSTYQDSNIDNFDFCYYSSTEWAFLFNVACLIFPCLLALTYNVYCFRTGLQTSKAHASLVVVEREARTTRKYLGALVMVWFPIIVMNLMRYFSILSTYTFINIIVILTAIQGILHTTVYVMSYRPLRRYMKRTLCRPCNLCEWDRKSFHDPLLHQDNDDDDGSDYNKPDSPLAAYDINTYKSPMRSSISGKSRPESEDLFDQRLCSGEQFVKFGTVQYNTIDSPVEDNDDDYNDEASDTFNDKEVLTPIKETKGWKKLVRKLTPPIHQGRHSDASRSPSNSDSFSPQQLHQNDQEYLKNYYKNLFHQAH